MYSNLFFMVLAYLTFDRYLIMPRLCGNGARADMRYWRWKTDFSKTTSLYFTASHNALNGKAVNTSGMVRRCGYWY